MTTSSPAGSRLLPALGVGVLGGFLSGLFGIGGGILIVPGLVLITGMGQRLAHGTSLAATLPIASAGVVGYATAGEVDWAVGAAIAGGAVVGAFIGTQGLQRFSSGVLRRAFAVLLAGTAVRMFLEIPDASGRGDFDAALLIGLAALGVVSGTLAGLLGVGGGVVLVPVLTIALGMPPTAAKGTSLAVVVVTAVVGTVRNLSRNNCDLRTSGVVGIAGVASAYGASKLSLGLSGEVSNVLFAILLGAVALRIAGTPSRAQEAPPQEASATP